MILKGSERGSGQNLAAHLLRIEDNDHVRLHELRGFAADDLHGAFKEIEAISLGTKCRNYLFSLSLSPPEDARVPAQTFDETIERIEAKLGLEGQPRAIVFHEKEGRRHAHCVWSRIDAETMTARPLPFYKQKLTSVARDLYLEHGWTMPRGLENAAERNPTNFTLAEWQQAKRQGMDPRWLKQAVQDCWTRSDTGDAFRHALQDRGLFLAKGDKRGFVVLDHAGDVWSLTRMLDAKTKDVRARLGDSDQLASVEDTRKTIGERMTPALRRHIEESRQRFRTRSAKLGEQKAELTQAHRAERQKLDERQKAEFELETRARAERLPKGLRGLWHRLTGHYQKLRALNEMEAEASRMRQAAERQALIDKQLDQRAALQRQFKELRRDQAQQLRSLRADIGRFLKFTRGREASSPSRARDVSLGLKLER